MSLERTNSVEIRTPEGVAFSFQLAGPVARMLALFIDWMVIVGCVSLVSYVLGFLAVLSPDVIMAAFILASFIIPIGYAIALEWRWRGQTLGKRALRLRVMDEQGLRLQFSQIMIRNLLRFVDLLPGLYALGGVACLLHPRSQRLGDVAGRTLVVREPKRAEPDLDRLMGGKFNSFRSHPHLTARLRQRVTPFEAGVALQALARRDSLEARARVELFAELAERFRPMADFPQEATEGLSDEQYVRNVVDVVFRAKGQ